MLEVPFARRVLDGSTDVSIVDDDFEIVGIAAAELLCIGSAQDGTGMLWRGDSEVGLKSSCCAGRKVGREQTTKNMFR